MENKNENKNRAFAEKLKVTLKINGLSVIQAARKTGVSKNSIYDYLAGTHYPTFSNLMKLSEGLNVSVSDFLGQ